MTLYLDFNSNLQNKVTASDEVVLQDAFFRKDRLDNCEFALGFDDYLQLAEIEESTFDQLNDFSVSLWVKNETNGFATILSVANAVRDNEFNINILSSGQIASNISNLPNVPGIRIEGDINVNDGAWHHIVLTRDGDNGETIIYVDNVLDVEEQMPLGVIEVGEGGFVLGNDQDCLAGCYSANQQFNGAIDDLRVYSRVLNLEEVAALYGFSDGEVNNTDRGTYSEVQTCDDEIELSTSRNFDQFSWNTGSQSSTITVNTSGTYIVTGSIRDCIYSDTTRVDLNSIPNLSISSDYEDLKCNEPILIEATEGFDNYIWQDGTNGRVYSAVSPGIYFVRGFSNCGDVASNQIEIIRSSELTLAVNAPKQTITCGEETTITASSGFNSYLWSNGSDSREITVSVPGLYEIVAFDQCGTRFENQIEISQVAEPTLELNYASLELACGGVLDVSASQGFVQYLWSNGSTSREITIDSPGIYSLTAISACGTSYEQSIEVFREYIQDYFIPNTITPNGDGLNEVFEIDNKLIGSRIVIYNRWGKRVYFSKNYRNEWNAENIPEGSYYFHLESECLEQPVKGWVKVIR